jgi:hypothetical protein
MYFGKDLGDEAGQPYNGNGAGVHLFMFKGRKLFLMYSNGETQEAQQGPTSYATGAHQHRCTRAQVPLYCEFDGLAFSVSML